jgi:hypothetical protein
MNISKILNSLIKRNKRVDLKNLPSQGLFYPDNFSISIKRCSDEKIINYEKKYDSKDLLNIINNIKQVVNDNTILSNGYNFNDIKSVDIVFLFLEIVKYTKEKSITIEHYNDINGSTVKLDFNEYNFNYYDINKILKYYNENNKYLEIDGFKYSLPTIGVENSVSKFLFSKSYEIDKYANLSYDFVFFVGNKSLLTFNEIENLIQIFNYDLSDKDKETIKKIVDKFSSINRYTLKFNNDIIDLSSKLNLEDIWK